MPSKGALRGVLHNFLGTYSSRYSSYRGYWLFGFLVTGDPLGIDLLAPPPSNPTTPIKTARSLAISRFADQVRKAGLEGSIHAASLIIERGDPITIPVFGSAAPRAGFEVIFTAHALATTRQSHLDQRTLHVAPHDPRLEYRTHGTP